MDYLFYGAVGVFAALAYLGGRQGVKRDILVVAALVAIVFDCLIVLAIVAVMQEYRIAVSDLPASLIVYALWVLLVPHAIWVLYLLGVWRRKRALLRE